MGAPRAVADGRGGTIIATAEVDAPPERVFRALTTNEVERWWGHPDFYRQTDWKADLRQWSVTVRFADGRINGGSGEFAEISISCPGSSCLVRYALVCRAGQNRLR